MYTDFPKDDKDGKMGRLNKANFRKALYYLKRNGLRSTYYAARERMEEKGAAGYVYEEPTDRMLEEQRARRWESSQLISIVVPVYRTPEIYLREMMDSVLGQTYPCLELVLADATPDDSVESVVRTYRDERIRYLRLASNDGIAENTNRGLEAARGDYIGLLDHDDCLTPDALYEMAARMETAFLKGEKLLLLYSDEDKCNQDRTSYYEPHFKEDFNLDLLLSNNYICHFLVVEGDLMRRVKFRKEYDGAQDYDLALRCALAILPQEERIAHISRVLYHWRCHSGSTAENPHSKQYAYDAGRRAVQDFADRMGWRAMARDLKHMGFYGLDYEPDILTVRDDVGAVGGRLLAPGKRGSVVAGGIYRENGEALYLGLPSGYSGYMHRAALLQDAQAVDIRLIRVAYRHRGLFEEVTGFPYRTVSGSEFFDASSLPEGTDYVSLSCRLGKALRQAGCRVVWDPGLSMALEPEPGK